MPKKMIRLSRTFTKSATDALQAAQNELAAASTAFKVRIQPNQMRYWIHHDRAMVVAPVVEIKRPRPADSPEPVPIFVMIIKSTTRRAIRDGAYLVTRQYQAGARTGKAFFTDPTGSVVATRDLIFWSWKKAAALFPEVYTTPMPQEIPNITSDHTYYDEHGIRHGYFDCSGVTGTLYFAVD